MSIRPQSGNQLRDDVSALLEARFRGVIREFALTGKKADIFFREPLFPVGERKIAVECKDWKSRPLTSKHIAAIRSEYDPAFQAKEIDALWIVAEALVEAFPKRSAAPYGHALQVFTISELQNSMINFNEYLRSLLRNFEDKGLSYYYMETCTESGLSLHDDVVIPWLASPINRPLAVFGGYGVGKSSYAARLASWLADRSLKSAASRIPILIRLGGLTQAQSIRDLITVQFAADHRADGFSYGLFSQLNALGRFVLLFDGFDEMKHAMRKRDVEANLRNISSLISPASKIILFGRPDPFVTLEDELFLRGKSALANKTVFDDPNRVEFELHTVAMFTESSAQAFINKYIEWNVLNNPHRLTYPTDFVTKRLIELRNLGANELIKRPVHAKILADLALIPDQNIKVNTEYELYYEFVSRVSVRETIDKDARAPIDVPARLEFMVEVAWWLWSKKKADSFSANEMPAHILTMLDTLFEDAVDKEAAVREMLIGSILERSPMSPIFETKDDVKFFFPHRSYWEFLLAEYLARVRFLAPDVEIIAEVLTDGVIQFLRQRADRGFMDKIVKHALNLLPNVPYSFVTRIAEMQNDVDANRLHDTILSINMALGPDALSEAVLPAELAAHILYCCKNWDRHWRMIDDYIDHRFLRGDVTFDSGLLTVLAWATTDSLIDVQDPMVWRVWQKIASLCVLKAYDDWYDKLSYEKKQSWSRSGKFPHPKSVLERLQLADKISRQFIMPHNVSGSQYYVAGIVCARAILFRQKRRFEQSKIIKLNVGFIPNILGNVKGTWNFGAHHRDTYIVIEGDDRHIVDVDLGSATDGILSDEQRRKLEQIVAHGKWIIDLGMKPDATVSA